MSASRERKKRLELTEAGQNPKQLKAAYEKKKKLRRRWISVISIVLVLAIGISCVYALLIRPNLMPRQTTAMRAGDHELSAVEFSYYYYDAINSFYQTYGSLLSYVMSDPTKPLDEQLYDEDTGKTWADYFIESASNSARYDYAAYDAAMKDSFTLSKESQDSIDEGMDSLEDSVKKAGYRSLDQYFQEVYGKGCSKRSYYEYQRIHSLASEYAQKIEDERTYTDEQIKAKDEEDPIAYDNVTYRSYYVSSSNYEETTDDTADTNSTDLSTGDEDTTADDAAKAAALASAEEDAKKMAQASVKKEDTFIEMAKELAPEASKSSYDDEGYTLHENQASKDVASYMKDWLFDEARVEGDTTYVSDNGTGYYVVYFKSVETNEYDTVNVRHILIKPVADQDTDNDGTMDATSDEAKSTAKAKAEKLLSDWVADGSKEDSFAKLADENSDDSAEGGLYENVYRGQMEQAFNDWCYDEARKPGDTDVVETSYGYHVVYFVGAGEQYRKSMIVSDLKEADYTDWSAALIEGYDITMVDEGVAYLRTDLVLGSETTTQS